MPLAHDTPTIYRFLPTPDAKLYGPRPLQWVGATYATREECECAPADPTGRAPAGPWRKVREWIIEMLPPPPALATDRQRARLTKLGCALEPEALTYEVAERLLREATGKLAPTKKQLARAAELGVAIPTAATRGLVEDLIDRAERNEAVRALRRRAVSIADDATWDEIDQAEIVAEEREEARKLAPALRLRGVAATDDMSVDDLHELDSARSDLDDALKDAHSIGFTFTPPNPLSSCEEMRSLASALYDTSEAFAGLAAYLDHFVEERWIPRRPSRATITAALPHLFDRVRAGAWRGDIEDALDFCRHALALGDQGGAAWRAPKSGSR